MSRTVYAMGLQETGKTTFLAAFWNVINATDVQGSLILEKTSGDMQYLNEIREAWADCKPITRTGPASDRPVTMLVRDSSGKSTDLAWTDMLGESFERQWTERAWSLAYECLVDDAVGILLFVHPRKTRESMLISEAQAAVAAVETNAEINARRDGPDEREKPEPYVPEKAPTQVELVELLQFVDARKTRGIVRVAVIVSAWDVVERVTKGKAKPEQWCRERLPLLHQYLFMNDHRFETAFFGVSAQGDDYTNAPAMRKAHHRASDRIKVVRDDLATKDITLPVRWALGEPA